MIFFRPVVRYNKEKFSAARERVRSKQDGKKECGTRTGREKEDGRDRSFAWKERRACRKQKQKKEKSCRKNCRFLVSCCF